MTIETFTEWLRLANTALAFVAFTSFVVRLNDLVDTFGRSSRLVWWGVAGLLLAVAYDAAESYWLMAPVGARSYFLNAFLTVLLVGLWRSRHDYRP